MLRMETVCFVVMVLLIFRSVHVAGTLLLISPSAPGRDERVTRHEVRGEPRLHDLEIEIPLRGPRGVLALRVLEESGEPRRSVVVKLRNESGSLVSTGSDREVQLDENGLARLEVPPGSLTIELADRDVFASLEGYVLSEVREIAVTVGETLPLEVTLMRGGRFRVTARDAAGAVATVGRPRLFDLEGERLLLPFIRLMEQGWTTDCDEPGIVLLGVPIPTGRYRVVLQHGDDDPYYDREVDIERGKTTEIEVDLR